MPGTGIDLILVGLIACINRNNWLVERIQSRKQRNCGNEVEVRH